MACASAIRPQSRALQTRLPPSPVSHHLLQLNDFVKVKLIRKRDLKANLAVSAKISRARKAKNQLDELRRVYVKFDG